MRCTRSFQSFEFYGREEEVCYFEYICVLDIYISGHNDLANQNEFCYLSKTSYEIDIEVVVYEFGFDFVLRNDNGDTFGYDFEGSVFEKGKDSILYHISLDVFLT